MAFFFPLRVVEQYMAQTGQITPAEFQTYVTGELAQASHDDLLGRLGPVIAGGLVGGAVVASIAGAVAAQGRSEEAQSALVFKEELTPRRLPLATAITSGLKIPPRSSRLMIRLRRIPRSTLRSIPIGARVFRSLESAKQFFKAGRH